MSPTEPIVPLSHTATATLAILCNEEETARRIEAQMRNSGHPVRGAWLNDLEEFEDLLHRSPPDLVLCSTSVPTISASDVVRVCGRFAPDLPTVFVSDAAVTPADTTAALDAGARDLVTLVDAHCLLLLERVCLRELRSHFQRRELRQTRSRLADFESRHKNLLAGTADAVVHVQEGIITHANTAFAALLGYDTPDPLQGNPLMDCVADAGQTTVKAFLKLAGQGKLPKDSKIELPLRDHKGQAVTVTAQVTLGQAQGERLLELLIRSPAAETVKDAPIPAAPSGRSGLMKVLGSAIKANIGMHRAVVVVMVDSFATIEQRIGYQESEEALDQIGAIIQHRLSTKEHMFRFSTALFAMVISRPNHDEFTRLAETVREDIAAQLFKTRGHETHLTATLVCYPLSSGDQAESVIDAAVGEVRARSRDGGNRVAVTGKTAEAAQVALESQRKADQVKKALMDNRLKLAYQSIASLEGDDHQHFDVLVRMLDEAGHEVPAKDFVPAAESHGVMVAVDRWVVGRALGVMSKRVGAKDQSSLFVRISEQTLREGDTFYKWFLEQIKARPVSQGKLVIAITEPVIETHVSKAKALCSALRDAGAELALDHFGKGAKSEQLLDLIPASYVRFDYAYSKEFDDPNRQARLAVLMAVAKKRDIRTIMGQVENASAMARLWQLGVNYIQGFHIQAPEAVQMSADVRR